MTEFSEDDFHDLLERGQKISDTASTIGWDLLVDRAHATMAEKQRAIIAGLDHDRYLEEVAWLKGAEFVLSLPDRVNAEIAEQRNLRAELQPEPE